MREVKLPALAETTNYSSGVGIGTPTKVAPPSLFQTEGKQPDQGFGSQWQNYLENALQKQIERSAQLPFRNWQEVLAVPTTASPPRFAFNRYLGATLIANGVNNSIKYIQEFVEASAGAPLGVTVAPAAGNFVPKDVASLENIPAAGAKDWVVVGSNSTAPTKTIWEIGRTSHFELTSPVSGSVECVCRDAVTGKLYAFAADTNRSVLVRDIGGTWTALGQRGSGAVAPAVGSTFCFANNGTLGFAYQTGGGTTVEKINTTSFSVTAVAVEASSAPLDIRWSPQLGLWMVLTNKNAHTSGSLTSFTPVNTTVAEQPMPKSVDGGCLHESGVAAWSNGSTGWSLAGAGYLYVQDYIGYPPHVLNFGSFPSNGSTGVSVSFDGSALWFMLDKSGTKRLFRSMRS